MIFHQAGGPSELRLDVLLDAARDGALSPQAVPAAGR
jgi:hypothetical protein